MAQLQLLVEQLEQPVESGLPDLIFVGGSSPVVEAILCLLNLDLQAIGHTFLQLATDFDQNLGCRWTTRHLVIPLE